MSNSHASSEFELQFSSFGRCVIVNLLLLDGQLLDLTLTLGGVVLNDGHGIRGIGTTMSRSISNSQSSEPPLLSHGLRRRTVIPRPEELESRQSVYFVVTVVEPPLMTGHGGSGIGISRSMSISNSQPALFVIVILPLADDNEDSHLFCCDVFTDILPVISGHGIGGSGGGGTGGSQSNIGGGVGGSTHSSTNSKSTHSTNGTSHLVNSAAPDEQYGCEDGAPIHSPS